MKRVYGKYIVTGANQTGSKHYDSLSDAVRYIKKLLESDSNINITIDRAKWGAK